MGITFFQQVDGVATSSEGRSHLIVEHASKNDEGTYTCLAKNQAGHKKAIATVQVKGMLLFLSSLFIIDSYRLFPLQEPKAFPLLGSSSLGVYVVLQMLAIESVIL